MSFRFNSFYHEIDCGAQIFAPSTRCQPMRYRGGIHEVDIKENEEYAVIVYNPLRTRRIIANITIAGKFKGRFIIDPQDDIKIEHSIHDDFKFKVTALTSENKHKGVSTPRMSMVEVAVEMEMTTRDKTYQKSVENFINMIQNIENPPVKRGLVVCTDGAGQTVDVASVTLKMATTVASENKSKIKYIPGARFDVFPYEKIFYFLLNLID